MPVINARDGQTYRVTFVHSAHDVKSSRGDKNPGGLRQFVDNLAISLRRRVTFAEVERVETRPGATRRSEPVQVYVPIGQGFAVCHYTDQFIKEFGRGQALVRALKTSGLTGEVKEEIAVALGYDSLADLKARFSKGTTFAPAAEPEVIKTDESSANVFTCDCESCSR